MNWDAVAAIGQWLGALLVLFSIGYLALQVRQANKHAAASADVAWIEGWNRLLDSWVADARTMEALRTGFRDFDGLDRDGQAIFQMKIGGMANHWILARQLSEKGLITHEIAETATEVLVSILSTPGGLQYWERDAEATPFGTELLAKAKAKSGLLPPFNELFPWWHDPAPRAIDSIDQANPSEDADSPS
jgi:hypothetical protein